MKGRTLPLWLTMALLILPAAAIALPRADFAVSLTFDRPFPGDIDQTPQLKVTREGLSVNFFMLLTNRGELDDTYDIAAEGAPAGWTAVMNVSVVDLPPFQSRALAMTVTSPASLAGGLRSWAVITASARSRYDPTCTTHLHTLTILNTTQGPALVGFIGPGQNAQYTLTVHNDGARNDTEAAAVSYVHHEPRLDTHQPWESHYPSGWTYSIGQDSFSLPAGGSAAFPLRLTAPADAVDGDYLILNISVRSANDPSRTDQVTVITMLGTRYGVRLECARPTIKVIGGGTARFSINVTNTGTMRDAVSLSRADPPAGWTARLGTLSVVLNAGETRPVELEVVPAADAPANITGAIRVRGVSTGNGTRSGWVDTFTIANPDYFLAFNGTDLVQYVDPGNTTTFHIGVRNLGSADDTALLDLLDPAVGWGVKLAPASVQIPPKSSGLSVLEVTAPADALAGARLDQRLRVRSLGDPELAGTMLTRTIVNRTQNLTAELLPPVLRTAPEQGAPFTLVVRNGGNGDEAVSFEKGLLPRNWTMDFNESPVLLGPRSARSVLCTVTPDYAALPGDHQFTALARTDRARIEVAGTVSVDRVFRFLLECDGNEKAGAPGTTVSFDLTLRNRGNSEDAVRLELLLDDPVPELSWTLGTTSVPIPLVGTATAMVNLTVAAGAPGGLRRECRVRGVSSGNPSYWREVSLGGTAGTVRRLDFNGSPPARAVLPGEAAPFCITVQNGGNVAEEVRLELASAPSGWSHSLRDGAGAPAGSFRLDSGRLAVLDLTVVPPPGARAGEYRLELNLTAGGTPNRTVRFTVRVLQVFGLELSGEPASLLVHAGRNATVRIGLRNSGNGPDEIGLSLQGRGGEKWGSLDTASVALEANSTGQSVLLLKPPSDLRTGVHRFEVRGRSAGGPEKNITVEVRVIENEGRITSEPPCFALGAVLVLAGVAGAWLYGRSRQRAGRPPSP